MVNTRPTHGNVSAPPGCWSRDMSQNVLHHSEEDIIFYLLLRKHVKSQIITNELGTFHSIVLVQFSGNHRIANVFVAANRQYHLNTITNNTHAHLDGHVQVLMTTHLLTGHEKHFAR